MIIDAKVIEVVYDPPLGHQPRDFQKQGRWSSHFETWTDKSGDEPFVSKALPQLGRGHHWTYERRSTKKQDKGM